MMGTILEKVSNVEILKVNVDKFSDIAQKYGVMSIPTLILFDKGKSIKNHVGLMSEDELSDFLK